MDKLNKRFLVKVFNLDWSFKKNIPENIIASPINYSENINGWQGMLKILLNISFNDTGIEKSDFVKVFMFDSNFPSWKLIYTGIIERIKRIYLPSVNQVELVCLWLWSLLTRLFFEKTGSKVFSENKDPWDIVKDVITYFNSVYTWSWLNDTGVTLLGSNTSINFDFTYCFEAIENLAESAGFYFLIKEDWTVIFQLKQATVTHRFTAWKDLQELVIEEDTQDLQNTIFLDYTGWQSIISDWTSASTWGKREINESRTDINLLATADITAGNILADKKDPKQKVVLKINNNFNKKWKLLNSFILNLNTYTENLNFYLLQSIEDIKPWDNIRVNNIDYIINNKQIQKINYTPEAVTIQLEEFTSLGKILNK